MWSTHRSISGSGQQAGQNRALRRPRGFRLESGTEDRGSRCQQLRVVNIKT